MAYSIDFRRKVLEIKERDGLSFEEAALRFGISKSSVSRWAKRLEPCRTRNKVATKINPDHLIRDVEQHPDAYQHERAERLGCSQRGIEAAEDQQEKKLFSIRKLMRRPAACSKRRSASMN